MPRKKRSAEPVAQDDKRAARRAAVLGQMGVLYARFRKPRGRGDKTFAAVYTLDGFFALATLLNPALPSDRDEQERLLVPVPLWALQHLLRAFADYAAAPPGKTLGEVLGIEGGGQGRRPAKENLLARSAWLMLARMVQTRRTALRAAGKPKKQARKRCSAMWPSRPGTAPRPSAPPGGSSAKSWSGSFKVATSRSDYPDVTVNSD